MLEIFAPILVWLATTIIFFIFNVFLLMPVYFKIKGESNLENIRSNDFVLSPFITLLFIVVIFIDIYEYINKLWCSFEVNVDLPFNYIGKLSNKMWGNK